MSKLTNRIFFIFFFLAAVFLSFVSVQAAPTDIFPEDKRVLLPVSGDDVILYYAYDEQGNCLGRFPATGWSGGAKLVSKSRLIPAEDNSGILIRASDLKEAASYPPEEYILRCLDSHHYLTIEKRTGTVTFYDENIVPLGSITPEGQLSPDRNMYTEIFELSDYFFLKLSDYHNNIWIRIARDGTETREILDPLMLQYLNHEDMFLCSLGNYLAVCPFPYAVDRNITGVVMTADGLIIMDRIEAVLKEKSPEEDAFDLQFGYDEKASYALGAVRNTGYSYDIYDMSLEPMGILAERPQYFYAGGGFVNGLAYPELNGNVCEGFVFDVSTQSWAPYARDGQSCLIWKDNRCLEIPSKGKPERISSAYCVIAADDGTEVYRTEDASLFTAYDGYWRGCLSLGSEGIRLSENLTSYSIGDRSSIIYDNAGNPTYHSPDSHIYAFINGTWTCRRGVYSGLIDMNGNWVIKDTVDWEI